MWVQMRCVGRAISVPILGMRLQMCCVACMDCAIYIVLWCLFWACICGRGLKKDPDRDILYTRFNRYIWWSGMEDTRTDTMPIHMHEVRYRPIYRYTYSEHAHAPIRFRAWGAASQEILKLRRSGVPKFLICAFFFFF